MIIIFSLFILEECEHAGRVFFFGYRTHDSIAQLIQQKSWSQAKVHHSAVIGGGTCCTIAGCVDGFDSKVRSSGSFIGSVDGAPSEVVRWKFLSAYFTLFRNQLDHKTFCIVL
jgi:hypothetical protein